MFLLKIMANVKFSPTWFKKESKYKSIKSANSWLMVPDSICLLCIDMYLLLTFLSINNSKLYLYSIPSLLSRQGRIGIVGRYLRIQNSNSYSSSMASGIYCRSVSTQFIQVSVESVQYLYYLFSFDSEKKNLRVSPILHLGILPIPFCKIFCMLLI